MSESTHWLKCPIIIILIEIEQQFAEHKWDQINRFQKRSSMNRICAVSQSLDKYRLTADQSNWFSTPNKAIKCFMALNVDGCHCSRFFILMTISNRIESNSILSFSFANIELRSEATHSRRPTNFANKYGQLFKSRAFYCWIYKAKERASIPRVFQSTQTNCDGI